MARARRAATAIALAVAAPAFACGYHATLGDSFAASHPESIGVAVAIAAAKGQGTLAPVAALPGPLGLVRTSKWLGEARQRLSAAAPAATPSIAVLLVEPGLWTRLSRTADGSVALEPHVDGPAADDVVVVTGEAVLPLLLDGRLSVSHAKASGMLIIAGEQGRAGLVEAWLEQGFGRRDALASAAGAN